MRSKEDPPLTPSHAPVPPYRTPAPVDDPYDARLDEELANWSEVEQRRLDLRIPSVQEGIGTHLLWFGRRRLWWVAFAIVSVLCSDLRGASVVGVMAAGLGGTLIAALISFAFASLWRKRQLADEEVDDEPEESEGGATPASKLPEGADDDARLDEELEALDRE